METENLTTEYLKSRHLEKETVMQFSLRQILEDYQEFRRKRMLANIVHDAMNEPRWIFGQWNIGWFTFYQNFRRIELNVLLDIGDRKERPLFGLSILFWSIEITFGK